MCVAKNEGDGMKPRLFYHKPSRLNDSQRYAFVGDYRFTLFDDPQFDYHSFKNNPNEFEIIPLVDIERIKKEAYDEGCAAGNKLTKEL